MPKDIVQFGDGLELDRISYELRRAGRALKLERIPLDILFLLVERNGQLVTREDIIGKIWGKDVFVDTDSSINGAIRKIRQALRDDPESPVFVQTVTGKGYRFIAAVTGAEVRAMTPRRSGLSSPKSVIVSSVRPSLKYSCSASLLRFAKGSTASMTRPWAAEDCERARARSPKKAVRTSSGRTASATIEGHDLNQTRRSWRVGIGVDGS